MSHAVATDYLLERLSAQVICPTLLCTGEHDQGDACVQPEGFDWIDGTINRP